MSSTRSGNCITCAAWAGRVGTWPVARSTAAGNFAGCAVPTTITGSSVEAVSAAQLRRCFQELERDRWQVRPEIRGLVSFERHNLMTPFKQPAFDCVFIRNVLIYFDRQSKRTVVANLIRALAPGGYLVVGPSEGIYDMLEPLERRTAFLYQKPCGAGALRAADP